jgi:citrate synthase
MSDQALTITDNRTGKSYKLPIENGSVRAMDLRQIKTDADDFGLMTYDPALMNTASTKSAITFIDGDKGNLEYRGYPVEQLAERSNFLEVAYLILFGELPNEEQLAAWTYDITHHTFVQENIKTLMQAFRYDAHPMGMFVSTVAALSTFYPEANQVSGAENRLAQIKRLIAKVPTIAAYTYRHNQASRCECRL